jgi:hypothetical protein
MVVRIGRVLDLISDLVEFLLEILLLRLQPNQLVIELLRILFKLFDLVFEHLVFTLIVLQTHLMFFILLQQGFQFVTFSPQIF